MALTRREEWKMENRKWKRKKRGLSTKEHEWTRKRMREEKIYSRRDAEAQREKKRKRFR
jgi:hypothetical protein